MTPQPVDPRSRPRYALLGLLLVAAFLSGLAVAAWAARRFDWFAPRPAAAPAQAAPRIPVVSLPLPPDLAVLAAREAALAARIAQLESRAAALGADAEVAGARAGRAEALLVAAAARRALDRGAPLGALEDQLRHRFGALEPRALDAALRAAREPVTLEDLRLGLDAVAPTLQAGDGSDWARTLRRELGALVTLRRAGAPTPSPAERLARVRRLLDAGRVDAALAEAQTLPGAPRAAGWTSAARRYLLGRDALDRLEAAALSAPAGAAADAATGPVS